MADTLVGSAMSDAWNAMCGACGSWTSLEHRAGGSRRLRSRLRAHAGFLPQAFRMIMDRPHATTVKAHTQVLRAVIAGDGDKAARYRLDDFRDAGNRVVRELRRRGVIARD